MPDGLREFQSCRLELLNVGMTVTSKYATHLDLYLMNRRDYDGVLAVELGCDERADESYIHDQQGT
jgi:hypothetical protein